MKSRFRLIEQASYDACVEKAKAVFAREEQELFLALMDDGGAGGVCRLLAAEKDGTDEYGDYDGEIRLNYEDDGVCLEIIPARGMGTDADRDAFRAYFSRKKVHDVDSAKLQKALEQKCCNVRIAPPQKEEICNAETRVRVTGDEMEAFLTILPPDPGGTEMTYEQCAADVGESGVVYGIDESTIKSLVERKTYYEEVCFARGTLPRNGEDGELIFHFSSERSGTPLAASEEGKVDYRELDLFSAVKVGDKLVSRKLATEGVPGYTVSGRTLEPKRGKEAKLPRGKNVDYDEDRVNMFAKVSGKVEYNNALVSVFNCYTVKGDADLSVGNLDFDGDIVITGNIISDLVMKASRNIEVYGVVEGAELIAGGNILMRKGIQGNDKGVLHAGGDITAKYMERTRMTAGGNIWVDSMIHCHAVSGGCITAKGKHGSIIGGHVRAQNCICAQNLGSVVNTKTGIEVGIASGKRDRMRFLETEMERLKNEMEKFEKIAKYLSQSENIPPEKEKLKKTVVLGKVQDMKLIHEYGEELMKLREETKNSGTGKVHVAGTVYPGVRIAIMLLEYSVAEPIKFATFKYQDRDITFVPCEM